MSRRALLVLPALLTALALPVAPALAGEDPSTPPAQPAPGTDPVTAPTVGTARLRAQDCVRRTRATMTVTGQNIASVVFFVDGHRVDTDSNGTFSFTMNCSHLSTGAHRARAAVAFSQGASPASSTLRAQITRARQAAAQFAG
jgi:hypothetical protein